MEDLKQEITFEAKSGNVDRVIALINRGVSINTKGSSGNSLLQYALMGLDRYRGVNLEIVRTLINRGIDVNLKNEYGKDALYDAGLCYIYKNGNKAFDLIVDAGADLNSRYDEGKTLLIELTERGIVNAVKTLIDKGADLNLQDNEGNTALHKSLERGGFANMYNNIAQMLISSGADLSIKNNEGKTALENIYLNGKKDYMDLIMSLAVCKDFKNMDVCLNEYFKMINKYEMKWNISNNNLGKDENLDMVKQNIDVMDDLKDCLQNVKKAIKNRFASIDSEGTKEGVRTINKYVDEVNNLNSRYMVNSMLLPKANIERNFNK